MTAHTLSMNKDISHGNLNDALIMWRRQYQNSKSKKTFGKFWCAQTGFKLPVGYKEGYDIEKDQDEWRAYGVIFDYIQYKGAAQ